MAHRHAEEERRPAEPHDGAFRCGLCPDHVPKPDNDWCAVATVSCARTAAAG